MTCKLHERDYRLWCDECHDRAEDPAVRVIVNLRAHQAEVEAERDMWQQRAHNVGVRGQEDYERAEAAEARLAAVEAALMQGGQTAQVRCTAALLALDGWTTTPPNARAAARGEGDRPAAVCSEPGHAECHMIDRFMAHHPTATGCVCGEGDRRAEPCPNCGQPVRVEDSHACIVTREGGS